MDDLVVRLGVAIGILAIAVLIAKVSRPLQRPSHPLVDLRGTALPNGVVVFTSSECGNCAEARRALKSVGARFREVTHELEPALFEAAGVESVPLIVVRDAQGITLGQLSGKPRTRRLRSLVAGAPGSSVPDS